MLDPAQFVAGCMSCLARGGTPEDIEGLVRQAIASQQARPGAWGRAELLHRADNLFIVNLTLPAFATSALHDHGTWAVIGISEGCEVDELLVDEGSGLRHCGRHELRAGDTLVMQPSTVHYIANPLAQPARGIHVYGRDMVGAPRRMWDPDTGIAQPLEFTAFEAWERRLTARSAAAAVTVSPNIPQA